MVYDPLEAMYFGDRAADAQRGRTMRDYWAAIPEVLRPLDRSVFENFNQSATALEVAFPVLREAPWHEHRTRLGLVLLGITKHTDLKQFKKLVEEVRAGQVNGVPDIFQGVGDDIEEFPPASAPEPTRATPVAPDALSEPRQPEVSLGEIRWLVIILAVLLMGLILVSVLYTYRNNIEIRAQVAGNTTRIDAIDQRVDRIDRRTADFMIELIHEKSTVVKLIDEKKQLEATFYALKGELDTIVREQVAQQHRKDVDVKAEIQKVSDRLESLQSQLDRLLQEQEREKETP